MKILIATMFSGLLLSIGESQPASMYLRQESTSLRVWPLDKKALEKLVHQRKGRVLVLNVWATWCVPCVEEFPELVKLDSVNRSKGVDVVTVSIDFDDEVDSKIVPFLRSMRASMPAYVNVFPQQEAFINALDPTWAGAVPATFVFDSKGALRQTFIGQRTYSDFLTAVTSARQ